MDLTDPLTLVAAWVIAPLLVALASAGIGVGLALVAGRPLGALTVHAGFGGGIALSSLLLTLGAGGRLTVALTGA